MSVKVMAAVFERYPRGGSEMLLALALADHADDDGTRIYPSVAHMAKKSRQSERSVQYQLRRMEASGWLILVKAARGGREGAGMAAEYRINPAWLKGADIAPFSENCPEWHMQPGHTGATREKGANSAPFDSEGVDKSKKLKERVQTSVLKGANQRIKGCKTTHKRVQPIAPQSSVNHQLTISNRQRAREAPPPAGVDNPDDDDLSKDTAITRTIAMLEPLGVTFRKPGDPAIAGGWVFIATEKQLLDAVKLARRRGKSGTSPIPAKYLDPIVREVVGEVPAEPVPNWWESASATEAKAEALGVARGTDSHQRFAARVFLAAGRGPWIDDALKRAASLGADHYAAACQYFEAVLPVDFPA